MSTSGRPRCLEGTQIKPLGEIDDWIRSKTERSVYWLYGVAGSGKSTIATTIADKLRRDRRLGAFLFFGRAAGKPEDVFNRNRSDPKEVIRTMAYQLAMSNPVIATHVEDGALDALNSSLAEMFEKLILDPLKAASIASNFEGPIVIMLDALDECGTPSTREELLGVFKANFSKLPTGICLLITSRPEHDLQDVFLKQESVHSALLDHGSETSRRDVSSYLSCKLFELFEKAGVRTEHEDQLLANINILCMAACGLFIWASTAYRYIANSGPEEFRALTNLVADIQSQAHSGKTNFGIDDLYSSVLRSQISWDKVSVDFKTRFRRVLYLILEVDISLSTNVIDALLDLSSKDSSGRIISLLQSVLAYTPGSRSRIRPLHASFSDFLKSAEQQDMPWYIDTPENNRYFTQKCLDSFDTMDRLLRFNICGFESSFKPNDEVLDLESRIKKKIPNELKDACFSWAQQLSILPFSPDLSRRLSRFLHTHLLFWLEVLSLTKKADLATFSL